MKKLIPVTCFFAVLLLVVTGCIKSVANDKHFYNNTSFHSRAPGASARDFLSDTIYNSLVVEIQYMKGIEPDEEALGYLRSFLMKHLRKPGGITMVKKQIDSQSHALTREAVISLEKQNREHFTNAATLTMYLLYANGSHLDTNLLGMAYRNTSTVIFGKQIMQNSNMEGKPSRTQLEASVLLHEAGHLLGLINPKKKGAKSHDDDEHPGHCKNRNCLMYHAIDVEDKFSLIRIRANIPKLDRNCLAMIKANGGKL
jgi:predicted Zn-dependent protease